MAVVSLCLRVLYTLNSDTQLFLAKSHTDHPVLTFQNEGTRFATIALRTCLQTLSRCSPELLNGTDYAVYVDDPLEVGQDGSDSIAVGMGLFSQGLWAEGSENVTVSGKVVKDARQVEALEIRMGLRIILHHPTILPQPTQPQLQAQHAVLPQPNPPAETCTPTPPPSTRPESTKRKASTKEPSSSRNDGSHTTKRSSRKSGEGASNIVTRSKKGKAKASFDSSGGPEPSSEAPLSDTTVIPSSSGTEPSVTTDNSRILALMSAPGVSEQVKNAALIALLSQMDGSGAAESSDSSRVSFLDALKGMLPPSQPSSTIPIPNPSSGRTPAPAISLSEPGGKENVSPRLTIRIRPPSKPLTTSSDTTSESTPSETSLVRPSSPTPAQAPSQLRPVMPVTPPQNFLRKRSAEGILGNSPRRNLVNPQALTRSLTLPNVFAGPSRTSGLQSSPPRARSFASTSSQVQPRGPASSPLRPQNRKKYVIPEWARTSTALVPRFPEAIAKQREEERCRIVAEREEKKKMRDRIAKREQRAKDGKGRGRISPLPLQTDDTGPSSAPPLAQLRPSLHIGPVLASSDISFPIHTRSVSPAPTLPAAPPQTPPRKRRATVSTPGDSSLFTPTPGAGGMIYLDNPSSPCRSPVRKKTRLSDNCSSTPRKQQEEEDDEDWLASEIELTQDSDLEERPSKSDVEAASPRQEYWPGLPPSSPIPPSPTLPSSPSLEPEPYDTDGPMASMLLREETETSTLSREQDPSVTSRKSDAAIGPLIYPSRSTHGSSAPDDIFAQFMNFDGSSEDTALFSDSNSFAPATLPLDDQFTDTFDLSTFGMDSLGASGLSFDETMNMAAQVGIFNADFFQAIGLQSDQTSQAASSSKSSPVLTFTGNPTQPLPDLLKDLFGGCAI
ncbi:hypothetical protein DL96DRAFT_1145672 [Flagelloscypha sp. PMI_526]|nr:hypothetical protein DL96DRAFT_1145672 [Flagelloscypha sp. PMI_526]